MADVSTAFMSAQNKLWVPELAEALHEAECAVYSYGGTLDAMPEAAQARSTEDILHDGYVDGELPRANRERHAFALSYLMGTEAETLRTAGWTPIDFVYIDPSSPEDKGARRMLSEAALGGRIVISTPDEAEEMLSFVRAGEINDIDVERFRANTLLRLSELFREAGHVAFNKVIDAR